jgi:hypothetical protein
MDMNFKPFMLKLRNVYPQSVMYCESIVVNIEKDWSSEYLCTDVLGSNVEK